MGESLLETYQRLVGEANTAKPLPGTPIEDLDVDVDAAEVTLTRTDLVLRPDDVQRAELASGPQHPSVQLTEAQMDGLTAWWAAIKKATQVG